jgi:hypothetical protein
MRKYLSAIAIVVAVVVVCPFPAAAQDAVRNGDIIRIDAKTTSFTVKTARGETNIVTNEKTVIKDGDKDIKFADLKVGDTVKVTGIRTAESVEAREVLRQPAAKQ